MQKIQIAKVLKPQGIKGEIKVELFLSDLDFWRSLKSFEIEGKIYNITTIRFQKNYGFIGTKEIVDRNDAETFRNKILMVEKPKNNSTDEFFIADLENCCVVDENNNIIGYVESVEKYSTTPIINVLINGSVKSFPFLKTVIKNVDINNKRIIVIKQKLSEVIV